MTAWLPLRNRGGLWSAWVQVALRARDTADATEAWLGEALLDTGAELCHIPDLLALRLELPYVRSTFLLGMAGGVVESRVYLVALDVPETEGSRLLLEVATSPRDKLVLGMSFLEHFTLTLEGRKAHFQLTV